MPVTQGNVEEKKEPNAMLNFMSVKLPGVKDAQISEKTLYLGVYEDVPGRK